MISFVCPSCGKLLKAKDEFLGRQAKCPACGRIVTVPPPVREVKWRDEPVQQPFKTPPDYTATEGSPPPLESGQPVPPQVVVVQTAGYDPPTRGREYKGFECPYCHTDEYPIVRSQISTAGWVLFVVLLIVCFPLCIIGLFIKEHYRVCGACGIRLG